MTIRQRQQIQIFLALGIASAVSISLFIMAGFLRARIADALYIEDIVESAFEIHILTNDYLIHPEKRDVLQWRARHAAQRELLGKLRVKSRSDRAILETIARNNRDIGHLFDRLVAETGRSRGSPAYREVLASQLLIRTQSMVSAAFQLSRTNRTRLAEGFQAGSSGLIAAVLLLLLIGAASSWLLMRYLIESLERLRQGTEVVAAGDLSHRIGMEARDEVGKLARAFDRMAERLQDSQKALRDALEELTRSNRDLEQFAYIASHDLKEPLRMVIGFTGLLSRRYKGRLDPDADKFIGFAVDGARRMQALIDDLLTFSRVRTQGAEFKAVSMDEALEKALANLQAAIGETGARVTKDPLPVVPADAVQMLQLFQNLVGNAIKYRKPSEPPRVHVSAQRIGEEWAFAVADNGIGIAPEFHERIFTIFQRLHTREEYSGTGIGLAVCKRIVERHGGKIWLESEEGKGSTFRFSIPEKEE